MKPLEKKSTGSYLHFQRRKLIILPQVVNRLGQKDFLTYQHFSLASIVEYTFSTMKTIRCESINQHRTSGRNRICSLIRAIHLLELRPTLAYREQQDPIKKLPYKVVFAQFHYLINMNQYLKSQQTYSGFSDLSISSRQLHVQS